ncbi:hypothetical protein DSUL_20247 [Desulfovibrionales bacterium]
MTPEKMEDSWAVVKQPSTPTSLRAKPEANVPIFIKKIKIAQKISDSNDSILANEQHCAKFFYMDGIVWICRPTECGWQSQTRHVRK